jgi:catechol 2,3-dioxygenase-like lactoylglutathione lyase family enzyme
MPRSDDVPAEALSHAREANTMTVKMDHVNIVVSDLEKAKRFFVRLGFQEMDSSDLSGQWISATVGLEDVEARYVALTLPGSDTNLELIEYRSPKSGRDPSLGKANQVGLRHLAFAVDDIEKEVRKLTEAGITFLSAVQRYPKTGKKLVYFHGPDGILLELAEYPA